MEEKLLFNLKNWYKIEKMERCSIDKTWLIEYNLVQLRNAY